MSDINFEDWKAKAKEIAEKAGKLTGDLIEQSKLQIKKTQVNYQIRKAYEKFGMLYYSMSKNGSYNETLIGQCMDELDALHAELDAILAEIVSDPAGKNDKTDEQPDFSVSFPESDTGNAESAAETVTETDAADGTKTAGEAEISE